MKLLSRLLPVAILLGLSVCLPARAAGASFPMQPNAYRPVLQQRVDAIWAVIEHKLDAHGVSADRKKQIRAMLDDAGKELWAEFNKAAADGSISKAEADHLREAARGLRAKVRAKMAAERRASRADKHKAKPAAPHHTADRSSAAAPPPKHDEGHRRTERSDKSPAVSGTKKPTSKTASSHDSPPTGQGKSRGDPPRPSGDRTATHGRANARQTSAPSRNGSGSKRESRARRAPGADESDE